MCYENNHPSLFSTVATKNGKHLNENKMLVLCVNMKRKKTINLLTSTRPLVDHHISQGFVDEWRDDTPVFTVTTMVVASKLLD